MSSQPPNITGEEMLNQAASGKVSVTPLTGLQRAGMIILLCIFIFSVVAVIPIAYAWITHIPATPSIDPNILKDDTVIARMEGALALYRTGTEIAAEQPLKWFDTLFTKMLYPLLTLVIGYVFGSSKPENDGDGT